MIYDKIKKEFILTLTFDEEDLARFQNAIIDSIQSLTEEERENNSKAFFTNIFELTQLLKAVTMQDKYINEIARF